MDNWKSFDYTTVASFLIGVVLSFEESVLFINLVKIFVVFNLKLLQLKLIIFIFNDFFDKIKTITNVI